VAEMNVMVIGNGIAGFSVASTIKRLKENVAVTMISKETTPLYSACVLPDYVRGKISRESTFVKTDQDYKRIGVHTLFGCEVKEVEPIARKVILNTGENLSFDKLILATGSDAITLGEGKKGILKLKTLKDADEILRHEGKKAVVVGSGAIGIEMAIALLYRGYEVTIIEMLERILPLGLDHKASQKIKGILEENGLKVINGERALRVLGRQRVEGLVTDRRELDCDTVVWAVGMRPRVELARQAGISIGEKGGIKVDSHMETNFSGIYACGDCVETNDILTGEPSLHLFWHNANRQGSTVGRNCIGLITDYQGSQNMMNIDIFGNHVVGFGYTETSLDRMGDMNGSREKLMGLSVIEKERNGSYYRLLVVDDRCIGGQFINVGKDLGRLWSFMLQRKRVSELLKILGNKELIGPRPWLHAIRPFFM
jgi:NADH oxidase (H2O2-forming)